MVVAKSFLELGLIWITQNCLSAARCSGSRNLTTYTSRVYTVPAGDQDVRMAGGSVRPSWLTWRSPESRPVTLVTEWAGCCNYRFQEWHHGQGLIAPWTNGESLWGGAWRGACPGTMASQPPQLSMDCGRLCWRLQELCIGDTVESKTETIHCCFWKPCTYSMPKCCYIECHENFGTPTHAGSL